MVAMGILTATDSPSDHVLSLEPKEHRPALKCYILFHVLKGGNQNLSICPNDIINLWSPWYQNPLSHALTDFWGQYVWVNPNNPPIFRASPTPGWARVFEASRRDKPPSSLLSPIPNVMWTPVRREIWVCPRMPQRSCQMMINLRTTPIWHSHPLVLLAVDSAIPQSVIRD